MRSVSDNIINQLNEYVRPHKEDTSYKVGKIYKPDPKSRWKGFEFEVLKHNSDGTIKIRDISDDKVYDVSISTLSLVNPSIKESAKPYKVGKVYKSDDEEFEFEVLKYNKDHTIKIKDVSDNKIYNVSISDLELLNSSISEGVLEARQSLKGGIIAGKLKKGMKLVGNRKYIENPDANDIYTITDIVDLGKGELEIKYNKSGVGKGSKVFYDDEVVGWVVKEKSVIEAMI